MVVQIEKSRGVGNIEVKAHIHSEQNTFQNVTKASVASKVFECKYIKYVGVQSRKAVHLPTLEIRVKQKGNRVMKVEPYWEKNKNKKKMQKKKFMRKKISELRRISGQRLVSK